MNEIENSTAYKVNLLIYSSAVITFYTEKRINP